jgi:hypothetical protein
MLYYRPPRTSPKRTAFLSSLISDNVLVFTTPHHLKAPKVPAAMRLGGAGVSG